MQPLAILIFIALLVYAAWLIWPADRMAVKKMPVGTRPHRPWFERRPPPPLHSSEPELLQGARVFMVEAWLYTKLPVPLRARVDEVYEIGTGEKLLLDTKVRNNTTPKRQDIVSLSTYGLILRQQGHQVLPWGYLRFHTDAGPVYKRVVLLDKAELYALIEKTRVLDAGIRAPMKCEDPSVCETCHFRSAGCG